MQWLKATFWDDWPKPEPHQVQGKAWILVHLMWPMIFIPIAILADATKLPILMLIAGIGIIGWVPWVILAYRKVQKWH